MSESILKEDIEMYLKTFRNFFLCFCFLSLLFIPLNNASSQIIRATGNAVEASSQIIYYYDGTIDLSEVSLLQITNTNDTSSVWIHVQLFRSYDPDNDAFTEGNIPPVFCEERNFVDFLTPNDTHLYELEADGFIKNIGETEVDPGESTSITNTDGTKGFVVITPVVSESDLSAISFQHLFGSTHNEDDFTINAMGRDAVDLSNGEVLPDNTVLDGTTGGFVLLQPQELIFDFETDEEMDVVGIAFSDVYGPPGLLGYTVEPADATWTSFIFDFKEDPTSCGTRPVNCFLTLGLNDDIQHFNPEFNESPTVPLPDVLLCGGANSPDYPDSAGSIDFTGWTRIFVSGLSDLENLLGFVYDDEKQGASWMFTK